jgi:HAD superfamily hydrolase (TIGR01549 family)
MGASIQAVLFDLDGVLVNSPLDLRAIKRELFGDEKVFIIEGIDALAGEEREGKVALLRKRELEAAGMATLAPGVTELFDWLESRNVKRGVITRNSREVVELIARKQSVDFGVVVGREDAPPKPDPECILLACRTLEVDPDRSVMVGDFTFDIEAGRGAGCRTVFVETDDFRHLDPGADARVRSLSELRDVLEGWLEEGDVGEA